MNTDVDKLEGWRLFCAMCREKGNEFCSAQTRNKLNRFHARYRVAANFETVIIRSYSEKAQRGYAFGFRLLAAYSAAELLGEATAHTITSWTIYDPDLASALRKNMSRPFQDFEALFSNDGLRRRLQVVMNGDNDVRPAATALRIMVAHGSFTPSGAEALTKKGAEALLQLSNVLLQNCQLHFRNWLISTCPTTSSTSVSVE